MDTNPTPLQNELRDLYRQLLAKHCPTERVRAAERLGFDGALWKQLASTGLFGMGVRQEHGENVGLTELAFVAELLGAHLAPVPAIESIVAVRAAARSGRVAKSLVEALASGERIATLALRPSTAGVLALLPAGAVADMVLALHDGELVLAEIAERTPLPGNLGSSPLADCTIAPTGVVIAERPDAAREMSMAVDEWRTLTAAALVGLAAEAFRMTVEYVKQRRAFGRLIGSFQSVAHRLADDVVLLDGARLLTLEAAWSADHEPVEASALSSMAFLYASEVAARCAGDAVHHHGGVGLTMEHDAQLYFRRAKAWPLVLADPRQEYQLLADRLYGAVGA